MIVPLDRCVRAATAVAAAHGLDGTTAVPLPESSNVLLHLRPFPVVARVMTATAPLHDDPRAWLEREVAVGTHLRARGAAATAPTTLLPPGPHLQDGLWITFWELVVETSRGTAPEPSAGTPTRTGLPEPSVLGSSLRGLHDALASYDGPPLRDVAAIADEIGGLLRGLRPGPRFDARRIAAAERDLGRLAPALRPGPDDRAIHGDASVGNVLITADGPVWNDFEDVCRGPVEWDLAGLVLDCRDRGATAAETDELIGAYGDHRQELTAPLLALHRLYGIAWHASRAELHPRSADRLSRHLAAADREASG